MALELRRCSVSTDAYIANVPLTLLATREPCEGADRADRHATQEGVAEFIEEDVVQVRCRP